MGSHEGNGPYALYCAVECREEASPDAEVAAEDGSTGFDCYDRADASFAVGGITILELSGLRCTSEMGKVVPEAFDSMPYCTSDGLRRC
jgi:hypothetical protein